MAGCGRSEHGGKVKLNLEAFPAREIPSARWLPLLIGAASLTATAVLWRAILASEELKFQQIVRKEAINVHNRIATHLNATMFEFLRSATRWERFQVELHFACVFRPAAAGQR